MENLNVEIIRMLREAGVGEAYAEQGARIVVMAAILLVSWIVVRIFRYLLVPALQRFSSQTKVTWDDHLFKDKVMHGIGRLIPPVIWYVMLPLAFGDMPRLLEVLQKGCKVYLIVVSVWLVHVFLNALHDISNEHETLRYKPLKGVYQMITLVAVCIGGILIVSVLIGENNTMKILAGLGASAAVVMLIFKDSILGLVAGVQLSANDMLRPGDWITMSKYGADGYVTEVTLTTVKVQNFDKTITTIPPYALVSDSFQNWRGMRECGGRRIKRSILVDADTVRFCSPEELARFQEKGWPGGETEAGRPVVNLQLFRRYVRHYLKNRPGVHPGLLQMVRMLQPTPEGIPVEIYCFSENTEWTAYEALQDDIFDHLLAVLPEFGLRVFQRPSGRDVRSLS